MQILNGVWTDPLKSHISLHRLLAYIVDPPPPYSPHMWRRPHLSNERKNEIYYYYIQINRHIAQTAALFHVSRNTVRKIRDEWTPTEKFEDLIKRSPQMRA